MQYAGGISLNGRLLHDRLTDFSFVCWTLLPSTPATRRYKVRLCRTKTQEIAVFGGGGGRYHGGGILLDGRLLHHHLTDSNSVCWTLLGSTPATRRFKIRLCGIKAQDTAVHCGDTILAEFYSMADYSTTV